MTTHPSSMRHAAAVRLTDVRRTYGAATDAPVTALDGVSLSFLAGTFTAVMGPSGSGKSTLLQCAAGPDEPTSGTVELDGVALRGRGETELTKLRRQRVGFVFQQLNLLPTLTVLQNVLLPLRLAGRRPDRAKAVALLDRVGMADRLAHRPAELSGGQQQRVAIARALIADPVAVFADEPTGALDTRSARDVLELLAESVRDLGQTVVMVTHDPVAAAHASTVVFLADGRLAGRLVEPTAEAVAHRLAHLGDATASTAATRAAGA